MSKSIKHIRYSSKRVDGESQEMKLDYSDGVKSKMSQTRAFAKSMYAEWKEKHKQEDPMKDKLDEIADKTMESIKSTMANSRMWTLADIQNKEVWVSDKKGVLLWEDLNPYHLANIIRGIENGKSFNNQDHKLEMAKSYFRRNTGLDWKSSPLNENAENKMDFNASSIVNGINEYFDTAGIKRKALLEPDGGFKYIDTKDDK